MKSTYKFGSADPNWGQQIQLAFGKVQRFTSELANPSPESALLAAVCSATFTLDDIKSLQGYAEAISSRVRNKYENASFPEHMAESAQDDATNLVNTVFDAYTYVHEHIQRTDTSPLLGLILCVVLATGCTTIYTPQGRGYTDDDGCGRIHKKNLFMAAPFSIVNNTGFTLDVYQNGELIVEGLETGQVLPIRQPFTIALNFNVTVVGRTDTGEYAGAKTWMYRNGYPEVWTVTDLYRPRIQRN